MLQVIVTRHWRISTSVTTGFPNQEEYMSEKSFVPSAIMLDDLPSLGIGLTGSIGTYSAATMGNLFKSGQS